MAQSDWRNEPQTPGVDYMEEQVHCDYCRVDMSRRDMFEHISDPCDGLRASQVEGERIIAMIQDQTQDPEPF